VLDRDGRLNHGSDRLAHRGAVADGTISGRDAAPRFRRRWGSHGGVNSVHIIDGRVDHCLLLEIPDR